MSLRFAYFATSGAFAVVTALAASSRDRNTMWIAVATGVLALGIYAAMRIRAR